MNNIWLTRAECLRPGRLPKVCLHCGDATENYVRHNFIWHPRWIYWTVVTGLLLVLILQFVLRQRMTGFVPLCPKHRRHWTWKSVITFGGGLTWLFLFFAVPITYLESTRGTPQFPSGEQFAWFWLGTGIVCLVLAAFLVLLVRRGVNVGEITPDEILFTNVAPEFKFAVRTDRDEWERKREERRRVKFARVVRARPVERRQDGE